MSEHIVVCGLSFGDEGKGGVVDYLSRLKINNGKEVTVCRFNGGAQCAHNVVLPDGTHHTFAQFGAGTLAGARTHLSRFMLVDPLRMATEAQALKRIGVANPWGMLTIERDALLTTPYHREVNKARELARGKEPHGSCGVGVGETMAYSLAHPIEAPVVGDCVSSDSGVIHHKLHWLQEWARSEFPEIEVPDPDDLADTLRIWGRAIKAVDRGYLKTVMDQQAVVFEGGQGVLLDEWYGFCLSSDTELLTKSGWVTYKDIRAQETKAACFDLTTGLYSWGTVQKTWEREYSGPMEHLVSRGMDCLVTPEHRAVIQRTQRAVGRYGSYDWTFCPANEVPGQVRVPIGGAPCGDGISDLSNQDLRIMGWVITDGCWNGASRKLLHLDQSLSTKKRGVLIAGVMRSVLDIIPDTYRGKRPARPRLSSNTGPSYSWNLGPTLSTRLLKWLGNSIHLIPREVLTNASLEQLQWLYQGLMEGDGTSRDGEWSKFYAGHNTELVDQFQELCLRLGISTTASLSKTINQWYVSIANARHYHSLWHRKPPEEYTGVVWDITVPTGAFVVRRNGKVFVTGNSPFTTWSTTTFENAQTLLDEAGHTATRLGVLRAYTTRHGPGPFVTHDPNLDIPEWHNGTSRWQKEFRIGHFDAVAHRYAIEVCGHVDALAITHLDRVSEKVRLCDGYRVPTSLDPVTKIEVKSEKEDLVSQEMITAGLKQASPVSDDRLVNEETISEALKVPVAVISTGPTFKQKAVREGARGLL